MKEQEKIEHIVEQLVLPVPTEALVLTRKVKNEVTGRIETREIGKFRIKILTSEERHQALKEAQRMAKDAGENQKDFREIYSDAQGICLVWKALVHHDLRERPDGTRHYEPVFVSPEQLLKRFTPAEISVCINAFDVVENLYSPFLKFDPNETNVWIARLSDPLLGAHFLSQLEQYQLPELLLSLAIRNSELLATLGQSLPPLQWPSESESTNSNPGTTTHYGLFKQDGIRPEDLSADAEAQLGDQVLGPRDIEP